MTEHETNTRKTLTVSGVSFHRCKRLKRPGESWSDLLNRAADALESPDETSEHDMNTLTEGHIDDIVNRTAAKTADELEARFR